MILSKKRSGEGKSCAIHQPRLKSTLVRMEKERKALERTVTVRARQKVMELAMPQPLSKIRAASKTRWRFNQPLVAI